MLMIALLTQALHADEKSGDAFGMFSVAAFGTKGDGQAKDTEAIQRAIDACASRGGGTVYFPAGTYLSGSLHLKSNVTLSLGNGATILGSKEDADYDKYEKLDFKNASDRETSFFHYALIWGEDVQRIAIIGQGTIDGNRERRGGPKPIALKRCRGVTINGITIRNAPNYNISMLGTDDVIIDGVTILNGYCDGIDPDACHNVSISNCHIESWDDAIVLKTSFSLGEHRSTELVTVTNCRLATACNAFKLGTESGGDFKRIAVSNCVMYRLGDEQPSIGGIALESVDGANVEGVVISNISMVDVRAPIFIRLGNRGRDLPTPVPGTLKNVLIDNVVATGASYPATITGIPDRHIEGVTLSNIRVTYQGGDPDLHIGDEVAEEIAKYPDSDMFKMLPAYGLYCRHVDGLKLSNLHISYDPSVRWRLSDEHSKMKKRLWVKESAGDTPKVANSGSIMAFDDVCFLDIQGLTIGKVPAERSTGMVLSLKDVRDGLISGCRDPVATSVYAYIEGGETRRIKFLDNDLRPGGIQAGEGGLGQVTWSGKRDPLHPD